jgi:hypothetical protein
MKTDNPGWGAPRIHGELLALGFEVSEPTVSRDLQQLKRRTDPEKAKRWLTFLHNHREVIAAFDVFTVPTLTFRIRRRNPPASGSFSNYGKPFRCPVPTATSCSIGNVNSGLRCESS